MRKPHESDKWPDRFPSRFERKRALDITPGINVPYRGQYALTDSGAISIYQPGQLVKPNRVLAAFGRKVRRFEPPFVYARQTSQQGSQSASPATFYPSLWPQRFEKSFYIADCFQLYYRDPAVCKSCDKFVTEAIRGSVKILCLGEDSLTQEAQDIADEYVENFWSTEQLFETCISMLLSGDLYTQAACIGQFPDARIDHFLTLPAAGMERCTDDSDRFIDPQKAFSQVDTLTWGDVAYFPLWSVNHLRWKHVSGERYGTPEILQARNLFRLVELCESAKVLQNQARAPMRLHWKIGNEENPASPQEVEDIMALNGYKNGISEPLNPNQTVRDFWTNAVGEITPIEGDQNVDKVEHIRYLLDRAANGLPTPRQIMSLGSENINRDILNQIRAEWMSDTERVNRAIEQTVLWGFRLQLMLQNIDPDLISYKCIWSKSTIMSEAEVVDMYATEVEAKLLSRKQARANLQSINQVANLDEEEKQIEKEQQEETDKEVKMRSAGMTVSDKLRDEGHSLNGNKARSYPASPTKN